MEYAEYSFVKSIDITRYDKRTAEEIAKWLTALMNTSSGIIVLHCDKQGSDKRDRWLRKLKDDITTKWITSSAYWSLVRHKYTTIDDQLRLYMFVTKSEDLITFRYNAYLRHATSTESVKNNDEVSTILHGNKHVHKAESQMKLILNGRESFVLDELIPVGYGESQNIEFKQYYQSERELMFSASGLKVKLMRDHELLENVSAFANTAGGSLILGVAETRRGAIIRGFPAGENQKQEENSLEIELEKLLNSCIWVGNKDCKPVRGADWDVFVYDVSQLDCSMRKIVEIRVPKHKGGMFVKLPKCFIVDDKGEREELKTIEDWRSRIHPADLHVDRESRTSQLEKHVKDPTLLTHTFNKMGRSEEFRSAHQAEGDRPPGTLAEYANTKLKMVFDGSETSIPIPELKQLECCLTKMAQDICSQQGQNSWYPSLKAVKRKGIWYQKLVDHINQKEWHGVASVMEIADTAQRGGEKVCISCGMVTCSHMLCYMVIVSETVQAKLICCFNDIGTEELDHKGIIRCALCLGRKLKRDFLTLSINKDNRSVPFHFEVLVLTMQGRDPVSITTVWDSEDGNNQPVSYPYAECQAQFSVACNGLAEKLLHAGSPVRDRYGDFLIDHLTDEQAKILLDRQERIMVVRGGSGTGKTLVALYLIRDAMARKLKETEVLYICRSEGLKAFVSYQVKCRVWIVTATDDLSKVQNEFILYHTKLVIVDDVHAISLGEDWKDEETSDLYPLLFTHAAHNKAEVAVFFDPDQNYYKSSFCENFDVELRNLAERIAGKSDGRMHSQDIKLYELKERIRNSREIQRFMQANRKQADVDEMLVCMNETEGHGVTYDFIGNNYEENAQYLDADLRALVKLYEERSIVVLFDDDDQLIKLKGLMKNKYHWKLQDWRIFPINAIVMCTLDQFGGLESEVVIFILPPSFGTENRCHWKYMNCVSSRAKQKLELLVPWNPDEDVTRLQKIKVLLALFQAVSVSLGTCKIT